MTIEELFNEYASEFKVGSDADGDNEPVDRRMDLQDFERAIKKYNSIHDVSKPADFDICPICEGDDLTEMTGRKSSTGNQVCDCGDCCVEFSKV